MRKVNSFLMAAALVVFPLAPAHSAADSDSQGKARARLERRADRLESQLHGKTGGRQRQEIKRQLREIDDVIRRIEAGESVDPKEVNRIVREIPLE